MSSEFGVLSALFLFDRHEYGGGTCAETMGTSEVQMTGRKMPWTCSWELGHSSGRRVALLGVTKCHPVVSWIKEVLRNQKEGAEGCECRASA